MELTKEMLIKECKLVRAAGQYVYDNHLSDFGQGRKFPLGWCGVLSRVLGAWLSTQYQSETFLYVCGENFNNKDDFPTTHAWVEYKNWILDITADQFGDYDLPITVISKDMSSFHKEFNCESIRHSLNSDSANDNPECIIFEIINKKILN